MCKEMKFPGGLKVLTVSLLLFLMLSCGSRVQSVGTYVSDAADSPRQSETTLELKDSGAGLWKVGDDEVNFSWFMKGDELRVHTKSGGVIVGSIQNNVIRISLPGSKEMSFKKVR